MKRINFVNNQIYHLFNRGTDKRLIFMDIGDYFRFVYNLYEFNDKEASLNLHSKPELLQTSLSQQSHLHNLHEVRLRANERKPLVDILAFCLMPNHFHLLVRQKQDGGITTFMRKLGTGYTNYFNIKNKRSGTLFQGKFKAVIIDNQQYLNHISYYIHANPIEIINHNWKKNGFSKNIKETVKFLESYRWSSYPDYIGKKNFPSITQRDFLLKYFGKSDQYKKQMYDWINEFDEEYIKDISLD